MQTAKSIEVYFKSTITRSIWSNKKALQYEINNGFLAVSFIEGTNNKIVYLETSDIWRMEVDK